MGDSEARKCPHCGNKMRSNNTRGVCKSCWDQGKRPVGDAEDSVLDRMGFGALSKRKDDAPPKPRPAAPRPPKPVVVKKTWQGQFHELAIALGLQPDKMLEDYCRTWVEETRGRALAQATNAPARSFEA